MRAVKNTIALAWHVTNFGRAGKGFKDLEHYLEKIDPKPAQTANEVAGIFESFAAQGKAKLTVRPRKKEGPDGG